MAHSTRQSVLVTGGAGMIGSNVVKRMVASGFDVRVVDNLWRGRKENLLDEAGKPAIDFESQFYNVDLSVPGALELGQVLDGIDYIVHLADVVAGIDYVFQHQGEIFRQNFLINSNVVTAARKRRLKGFVYVGTACSFPHTMQTGIDAPPLKEEDIYPAWPESSYGWSKLMGEYEALLMEQETDIPVSVLSLHNVYGAPCDYGPRAQVIPALVRKAIRHPEEPFIVWGSGSQGRAFLHVDDTVDAVLATLDKGLGHGVIQIGPDVCTSIRTIAETVVAISGKPIPIEYDVKRPEGDKGRRADFSKAHRILGWEPRTPLRGGLLKLYTWMARELCAQT